MANIKKDVDVMFTVKIKGDEDKLPVFIEGQDKGVIAKIVLTFKNVEGDKDKNVRFQMHVQEQKRKFMEEYFEVTAEEGDTM